MESWTNYAACYLMAAYVLLHIPLRQPLRNYALAALNMVFTFLCFFYPLPGDQWWLFLLCIGWTLWFYLCLRIYVASPHIYFYTLAVLTPLLVLAGSKAGYFYTIVGFSYLVFRITYLIHDVRAGKEKVPALADYMGFVFFPLTFLIGPINPYRFYASSLQKPDREITPLVRSLERILVGMLKLLLVAPLFKTMNFTSLVQDGYYHGISDFVIACICSYLYFYFNFSGACDAIIGAAGILNIRVKENFNNTLLARNMQDFWNRTHITLSHFARDVVFTPGVLVLSRRFSARYVPAIVVTMMMITFLLIGLWHGTGFNFIVLGLLHGFGLSVFYLYSLFWKTLPVSIQRLSDTLPARLFSTALTFLYISFTSIFLENDWATLQQGFASLQLG